MMDHAGDAFLPPPGDHAWPGWLFEDGPSMCAVHQMTWHALQLRYALQARIIEEKIKTIDRQLMGDDNSETGSIWGPDVG